MVLDKERLIVKATAQFSKVMDQVGGDVTVRVQPYSVGSIYGERVNGTVSGTTVKAVVQPISEKFLQDSAGKWKVGDSMGFFLPGEIGSGVVGASGGSVFFVNSPSGTNFWYKPVDLFNEVLGDGSVIFTQVMLKLMESGAM